jgi:hypothetical protein
MKKIITLAAVVLFTISAGAQDTTPQTKEGTKTEKTEKCKKDGKKCSKEEKAKCKKEGKKCGSKSE